MHTGAMFDEVGCALVSLPGQLAKESAPHLVCDLLLGDGAGALTLLLLQLLGGRLILLLQLLLLIAVSVHLQEGRISKEVLLPELL